MPAKSKVENDLARVVAQYGVKPYLKSTRTLIALLDSKGGLVASNPAFDAIRKILPDATALTDFVPTSARSVCVRLLGKAKRTGTVTRGQLDFRSKGHRSQYDCLFIPMKDERLLLFAEPLISMTDLQKKYQRLTNSFGKIVAQLKQTKLALEIKQKEVLFVKAQADEVSHIDSLTLLPNRKQVMIDLQREVMSSERYGTPLSVSMVDFDHFKQVNDTYGHSTGDDVLRFIGDLLRENIRVPDTIGRYGGEEFLIVLPKSTVNAATEQAARLCEQVRSTPIPSGKHVIRMTISIGIAQYRIHGDDWQKLLGRSDQALYQAKNNGRDQWAIAW